MKGVLNLIFPDRLDTTQLSKFMYFQDEKLILAMREHWLPLGVRILKYSFLTVFISAFAGTTIFYVFHAPLVSLTATFLVFLGGTGVLIRELVHWHFHLYVVTNHKLLEIKYDPLFSEETNSVLLDQIRCTEIDAELHGILSEILNIGNVEITFDRPTHQEIFTLRNIRSPRKVATLLSGELHKNQPKSPQESIWYRNPINKEFTYLEGNQYGTVGAN